ncbi:hypothetical protein [Kitasatospora mediocidica]|uniref:hypothetical protein n=1 Tax=Kitasatospora mediocidica TaxID=58352 RepID=UPI00068B8D87|nr:hypothetical protein [Kitasatospora mediocidica]
MSTVIVLVILAVVIVAAAAGALPRLTTQRLRRRFGPEYDSTVSAHGGRTKEAEKELSERLRLVRALELKPLSRSRTESVVDRLAELQEMFVDDPARAVAEADRLLDTVLGEVGFPVKGRIAAVSVDHGDRVPAYRTAAQTLARGRTAEGGTVGAAGADGDGPVGTEEFRTALLAIRDLCLDVLRAERPARGGGSGNGSTPRPAVTPRTN